MIHNMMVHAIFPFLVLLHLAASDKASITQAPVFTSQRPCVRGCFTYGLYEGPDRLAEGIGCDYRFPQNECFCRPDLQADADAFLLSCVNHDCSQNTLDTNSATSIYDEYCTSAGFLRNAPATPTSDPSSPTNAGETPSSAPTNSTSGGNSGGSGNSLGTGEIIGIVVGIAGFIATAIGTWFTYKSIMSKKHPR
ncbi:hypothetical protein F4859DRAFT_459444 [Xylaria cf. heliscus]|nr:hypothetical protein F4859DRAFT_459444 [Xylaria cf. heliscus]